MRSIFLILAIVAFSGCGPHKDDIFINDTTGERIEIIETGICQDIKDLYEGVSAMAAGIATPYLMIPVMDSLDAGKRCFAYRERVQTIDADTTFIHIRPVSDLEGWTKDG